MTLYLLDTNMVSDLIHQPAGLVARAVARVGSDHISTSIIVASELRYGASKRGLASLTVRVTQVLLRIKIWPFEPPADEAYGKIRAALERAGTPIGPNDLLIVAHCLALDAVLVSANEREFSRVENLRTENWLR